MLAAAIIVFREVLEAVLIMSIVLGASRGVARRGLWVAAGVVAGVTGAGIIAVSASAVARLFSYVGQPLLNAGILLVAVLTLSWHAIWMAAHGRSPATKVKMLGHKEASVSRRYRMSPKPSSVVTALCLGLVLGGGAARADDLVVYSPYVVQRQSEIEFRGDMLHDRSAAVSGTSSYQVSVAHAFTGWWRPELYLAEYRNTPGAGAQTQGYEFENVFQLTRAGKYWADVGFLASYHHQVAGQPDDIEFGPLLERRDGRVVNVLNLIWEKQIAPASSNYEFRTAYSLRYQWRPALQPGFETYIRPDDHAYQAGPVVYGELLTASGSELEYSTGVVLGINRDAPDAAWLLRVEYEFF